MNGSHGEKTRFPTTRDIRKRFKGASEVTKNGKALGARQKVYRQETCDPISPRLLAGEPETFEKLLSRRAEEWKVES